MTKQKLPDLGFVVGHRLDVNERARQRKQVHDCFLEWNGREGKSRRKFGACHSSIALHPQYFTTDDSGQVLGLAPNRLEFSSPSDFGGSIYISPFARAPEADRKARPATNGIRTSTKYRTKVANGAEKVNLRQYPKDAFGVSIFWGQQRLTLTLGSVNLALSK